MAREQMLQRQAFERQEFELLRMLSAVQAGKIATAEHSHRDDASFINSPSSFSPSTFSPSFSLAAGTTEYLGASPRHGYGVRDMYGHSMNGLGGGGGGGGGEGGGGGGGVIQYPASTVMYPYFDGGGGDGGGVLARGGGMGGAFFFEGGEGMPQGSDFVPFYAALPHVSRTPYPDASEGGGGGGGGAHTYGQTYGGKR